MKKNVRKLTDDEKQKIIMVINDFSSEYLDEEIPEYEMTEYDALMKKKTVEWKLHLLEDNESSKIEELLVMCEKYLEEKEKPDNIGVGTDFAFIVMYDMWLNKSNVWPVMYNPEWEEWNKLKLKPLKSP